ncbi:MAG: molybdenum cofactor guanylyltransferase [Solirubrobacteraceae bacterium]
MTATAGLVLAGGRSRRMGAPKASLDWHGSTLVRHAVGIVGRAVDGPVVVVRAPGQPLPALPAAVEIVEDAHEGRGPLEAIAAGLAAVGDRAQAVYVCGVDAPLLHPAFVRRVLVLLGPGADVALPRAHGFAQPLAAAYRTTVAAPLRTLLHEDEPLGTSALLRHCRVTELDEAAILADPDVAAFDPALDSLLNLNEPGEYEAARARPEPAVTVRLDDGADPRTVRAAILAAAASAAGLPLGEGVLATLNGRPVDDPQEPLVTGDTVALRRGSSRSS